MTNKQHTILLGAGGVASYLVPAWCKTFPYDNLIIMDGDRLEKRNLDRQLFDSSAIGQYKATALAEKYGCHAINEYFDSTNLSSNGLEPKDISCILCAVDNHVARYEAIKYSHNNRSWDISTIIGANEYWTSQAYIFNPTIQEMYLDNKPWPLFKYPEIATDKSHDPTNPSCVEQQESAPQLAGVNMITASLMMQLALRHTEQCLIGSNVFSEASKSFRQTFAELAYAPTEFQTTFGATQTQQLIDHDKIKAPTTQKEETSEDKLLLA